MRYLTPQSRVANAISPRLFPLLSLLSTSLLITVFTFHGGKPIGWGDGGLVASLYDPSHWLRASFYAWDPNPGLGGAFPTNQAISTMLPFALGWTVATHLGLPQYLVQALYFFFVLQAALYFSYAFLRRALLRLGLHDTAGLASATIGSIATVVNVYSLTTSWRLFESNIAILALTPFTLWLIGETAHNWSIAKTTLALGLGLLLFSPALLGLGYLIPVFALDLAYALWLVGTSHGGRRLILIWSVSLAAALVLDSAVIYPAISSSLGAFHSANTVLSSNFVLSVSSSGANIPDAVRGMVVAPTNALWLAKSPSWRYFYSSGLGQLLGYMLLLIAGAGIGLRPRKLYWFGIITFLTGLLLSLGTSGPTGAIYQWLFTHVGAFTLFRIPYLAFQPLVSAGFGIMVACAIPAIATLSTRLSGFFCSISINRGVVWIVSATFMAAFLLLYAFPLTFGIWLNEPVTIHGPVLSSQIQVPSNYATVSRYLAKVDPMDMSRVLALPLSTNQAVAFRWQYGYDGPNVAYLLLHHPTISYLSSASSTWTAVLTEALTSGNVTSLIKDAGLLDCRYVLLQFAAIAEVYAGPTGSTAIGLTADSEAVRAFLRHAATAIDTLGGRLVLRAGDLSLYQLPDPLIRPMLYAVAATPSGHAPILTASTTAPGLWNIAARGGAGPWWLVLNTATDPRWVISSQEPHGRPARSLLAGTLSRVLLTASGFPSTSDAESIVADATRVRGAPVLPSGNAWLEPAASHVTHYTIFYSPQITRGLVNIVSIVAWSFVCGVWIAFRVGWLSPSQASTRKLVSQ